VRSNTDLLFILKQDMMRSKKSVFEDFGNIYHDENEFYKVLDHYTNDRGIFVVNNRESTNNPLEKFFYFKAKETGPFRLGCKKYWRKSDWEKQRDYFKAICDTKDKLLEMKSKVKIKDNKRRYANLDLFVQSNCILISKSNLVG